MNAIEFCYWLQGFFEIREARSDVEPAEFDAKQVAMIRKHLELVLTNVTDHEPLPESIRAMLPNEAGNEDEVKGNAILTPEMKKQIGEIAVEATRRAGIIGGRRKLCSSDDKFC